MQYWQYRSLGTSTVTAVANMGIVYLVYAIFDTGLQIHAMYCLDSQATCPRFELGTSKILNELLYVSFGLVSKKSRGIRKTVFHFTRHFMTPSCEINFLNAFCSSTC